MAPISREEVTDEVLMMRFQGGDRSAFAGLVRYLRTGTPQTWDKAKGTR